MCVWGGGGGGDHGEHSPVLVTVLSTTRNQVCVAVLRGNGDSFAGTDGNWTHESPGGGGGSKGVNQ